MRLRPLRGRPAAPDEDGNADLFGFDLASVETYLVAVPVLRCATPTMEWYPVPAAQLADGACPLEGLDTNRIAAERRAADLGLTLRWPERHPEPVPRAMRAARRAAREGFGGPFMEACSRLAFAGGFDLDGTNPNAIEAAARVAGRDARTITAAEREDQPEGGALDAMLLASLGIKRLPALRIGDELACGEQAIAEMLRRRAAGP